MKRRIVFFGLAAICLGQMAKAQTMLTAVSLSANAAVSTTSTDYRYTRHTYGSPRTGIHTYYTWDPHTDEQTTAHQPMILNGASGNAITAGTYYAPTYSATASASTSLSNSGSQAVFTTTYQVVATLDTPQVAHQRVAASAQPGGTFYFTLPYNTNVTVSATGSSLGVVRIFNQNGAGVVVGPLFGAGTIHTETSLPPGNYRIDSSLAYSAIQDTQLNVLTNPGTTSDSYTFSVTFTSGDSDTATVVSGNIGFEGIASTAPAQNVTFRFHPADNSNDIIRTASLTPSGEFRFADLPPNQYTLHIKGDKYLATNVSVNTTDGDVVGLAMTLKAGDANNDNVVDIGDLLLLISHYNQTASDTGYLEAADFNGDGVDDIADLLLLIANYNQSGAN